MRIVTVGATFIDIKGFPENLYVPLGRNKGHVEFVHGGVARNVAINMANMGQNSSFVSIVDESGLGDEVITLLNKIGVETRYITKLAGGMGTYLAVFDEKGDLAGSISQRPVLTSIMDLLEERGDEIVSLCDAIVLEADIDRCIMERLFDLCEKYNKKIFSIVSNMPLVIKRRDLVRRFTCFICNDVEISQFFNIDFTDMSPYEMGNIISEKVIEAKLKSLVVTLGDQGALYFDNRGNYGHVPARKVDVVDTTGAGDAFCSGLSAAVTCGKSLKEGCELGALLASMVITSTENHIPAFTAEELGLY